MQVQPKTIIAPITNALQQGDVPAALGVVDELVSNARFAVGQIRTGGAAQPRIDVANGFLNDAIPGLQAIFRGTNPLHSGSAFTAKSQMGIASVALKPESFSPDIATTMLSEAHENLLRAIRAEG